MSTWNRNSSFSGQSGGSQSNLLELQGLEGRFLSRNSFLTGLQNFLHSSQQDLALRTTLGGGYGRYVLRTNHEMLSWVAGAVYTHENFQTSDQPAAEQALPLEREPQRKLYLARGSRPHRAHRSRRAHCADDVPKTILTGRDREVG